MNIKSRLSAFIFYCRGFAGSARCMASQNFTLRDHCIPPLIKKFFLSSSLSADLCGFLRKNGSVIAVLLALLISDSAFAGDQGSEFDDVWNTLLGWAQGTLGKIIALSMMLVGIIAGVARQSIMAFAMGIAAGLGLFYAPGVINGVVSADISSLKNLGDSASVMMKLAGGL